jgi:DNA-directed RNA polymerase specialized sigma24 family protein
VTRARSFGSTIAGRCEYAHKEDFVSVFDRERVGLHRLAHLLTGSSEIARRCLGLAFRECMVSGSVSKGWVLSWARRTVIRNAIRLVKRGQSIPGTCAESDNGPPAFTLEVPCVLDGSEWILDLPECDRLAYVICVLERYATQDCALLLGKSVRDVDQTLRQIGDLIKRNDQVVGYPQGMRSVLSPVRVGEAE